MYPADGLSQSSIAHEAANVRGTKIEQAGWDKKGKLHVEMSLMFVKLMRNASKYMLQYNNYYCSMMPWRIKATTSAGKNHIAL